MEKKEKKILRVKFEDRVLLVTLDLPRGRDTEVEFAPLKDGWDIEFEQNEMEFEEGSRLVVNWSSDSPLGTVCLIVERWHDFGFTKDIWVENVPIAVLQPSPEGDSNIFWIE